MTRKAALTLGALVGTAVVCGGAFWFYQDYQRALRENLQQSVLLAVLEDQQARCWSLTTEVGSLWQSTLATSSSPLLSELMNEFLAGGGTGNKPTREVRAVAPLIDEETTAVTGDLRPLFIKAGVAVKQLCSTATEPQGMTLPTFRDSTQAYHSQAAAALSEIRLNGVTPYLLPPGYKAALAKADAEWKVAKEERERERLAEEARERERFLAAAPVFTFTTEDTRNGDFLVSMVVFNPDDKAMRLRIEATATPAIGGAPVTYNMDEFLDSKYYKDYGVRFFRLAAREATAVVTVRDQDDRLGVQVTPEEFAQRIGKPR